MDLEAVRRDLETLARLALERPQLDALARWIVEMSLKTLRGDGGDDDRK